MNSAPNVLYMCCTLLSLLYFGATWSVTLVSEVDDAMSEDSSVSVDSAYTKVVRYGASRPRNSPRRETGSSGLCVSTHTLSADEAKIGKGDRGKELSLLDDEPFRLVYQNGLGLQRCLRVFNVKVRQDWHGAGVADEVAVSRATTRGVIARLCGRVAKDSL